MKTSDEQVADLLDVTFSRKAFYVQPPQAGASDEEWSAWLLKDDAAAKSAKAAHTREVNKIAEKLGVCDMETPEMGTRKVGGKYVQTCAVSVIGDADAGTTSLEPVCEASQESEIIRNRIAQDQKRGTKSKGNHARRKAAKARAMGRVYKA